VDLGCAEGQWLDFLHKQGIICQAVEINSVYAEKCRDRGLNVIESDMLSYLSSLPEHSVTAVTGFHIIEYLEYEDFIRVIDESFRVLKPGGLIIFETLNPQNVLVSSFHFYADPRYKNLIPNFTLKLIAEARGFVRVKTIELHPPARALKDDGSELTRRFNEHFYCPRDYALIGYRA
jgi:O-antigen chain-terminating methyltransferase